MNLTPGAHIPTGSINAASIPSASVGRGNDIGNSSLQAGAFNELDILLVDVHGNLIIDSKNRFVKSGVNSLASGASIPSTTLVPEDI